MPSSTKGRKGKIGKNKGRIAAYYSSGRVYWNKARKLVHHLRRFAGDKSAITALESALAAMPLHMSRSFEASYKWENGK